MKTLKVFSVAFALMALLFVGCGGDDDDDDSGDLVGPDGEAGAGYLGLSSMQAGAWSEYTDSSGNRFRMEYLGTDTYNGIDCFIVEYEYDSDEGTIISQIWLNKTTFESVLYVIKQGALLMKMDISQVPEVVAETSDSEDNSSDGTVTVGTETYTTPTGKSVKATVYQDGSGESWISGEVPFGMVKTVYNGEVNSELYDFGSSGATRDISKAEAESAESFEIPDIGDFEIPDL